MKFSANSVEVRKKDGKISSQLAAGMLFLPWRDQHAPARHRLLDAEPEKGEEALEDDHLRHQQGHVDDHRSEQIGNDVAPENAGLSTPSASAACTYSCRLIDSVWPRTIRAMSSHSTAADRQEHQHEIAARRTPPA